MSSNKYLLFSILHENYGIPIEKVKEIIRYEPITPVHDSLEYVKGVINLRGKIIPVFDLKLKFGLTGKPFNDKTVFIITDIISANGDYNVALVVDEARVVTPIEVGSIKEPLEIGLKIKNHYLRGIYRFKKEMVMLLNIDEIIKEEGVLTISEELYT